PRARRRADGRGPRPRRRPCGGWDAWRCPRAPGRTGSRTRRVSREGCEQLPARLLAGTTRLGAHLAVLVHVGVLPALVTTGAAGRDACLEVGPDGRRVEARVPGQDACGGAAAVGAVEVQADAGAQLGDHVLAQARVRAGRARLGALDQRVDGVDE